MQSSKLLLLSVIGQGPHEYGVTVPAPTMGLTTFADCNITVQAFNGDTDEPLTEVSNSQELTLRLTFTNSGGFPFTCVMPQTIEGLYIGFGWDNSFPIVPANGSVSVEAAVQVIGEEGLITLDFLECPEPLSIPYQEVFPQNLIWWSKITPTPITDISTEALAYYLSQGVDVDTLTLVLGGTGNNPSGENTTEGVPIPGAPDLLGGSGTLHYKHPLLSVDPANQPTSYVSVLNATGAAVGGEVSQRSFVTTPSTTITTGANEATIERLEVLDVNGNVIKTIDSADPEWSAVTLGNFTSYSFDGDPTWWPGQMGLNNVPYQVKMWGTIQPPPDPTTVGFHRQLVYINPLGTGYEVYSDVTFNYPSFIQINYPRLNVVDNGAGWPETNPIVYFQLSGDLIKKTSEMESGGSSTEFFYLSSLNLWGVDPSNMTRAASIYPPASGVSIPENEENYIVTPAFCSYPGVDFQPTRLSYQSNGVRFTADESNQKYTFTHAAWPAIAAPTNIYYYSVLRLQLPHNTPTEVMFPNSVREKIYYEVEVSGDMTYVGSNNTGGTSFWPVAGSIFYNGLFFCTSKPDNSKVIQAMRNSTTKEIPFTYNPAGTTFGVLIDAFNKEVRVSVEGQWYDWTSNTFVSDPANTSAWTTFSAASGASSWTPSTTLQLKIAETFSMQFRVRETDTYKYQPVGTVVYHDANRRRDLDLKVKLFDTSSNLEFAEPLEMTYRMVQEDPSRFTFEETVFNAGHRDPFVQVAIRRQGSSNGPAAVKLKTRGWSPLNGAGDRDILRNAGFAVVGVDLDETVGTFKWEDGEADTKLFNYPLKANAPMATLPRRIHFEATAIGASYLSMPSFTRAAIIQINNTYPAIGSIKVTAMTDNPEFTIPIADPTTTAIPGTDQGFFREGVRRESLPFVPGGFQSNGFYGTGVSVGAQIGGSTVSTGTTRTFTFSATGPMDTFKFVSSVTGDVKLEFFNFSNNILVGTVTVTNAQANTLITVPLEIPAP